jgi:multidrug efflux pump subunit AcrA (membrane-fusion protein)
MRLNGRKVLLALGLSSALVAAVSVSTFGAAPAVTAAPEILRAFTAPCKRSEMHFPAMGIIKSIAVKEGQAVKKGDLLMTQDDVVERDELEKLTLEATDKSRLEYYRAAEAYKKFVYEQVSKPSPDGKPVFSVKEIGEAQLDYVQSQKQINVIELDIKGAVIKARQQQNRVDRMQLKAEFDGKVEKIGNWEGELATPDVNRPSITLVQNDPCHIVITNLKTAQVANLRLDQKIEVRFIGESQWRQSKVIYIAPVAVAEGDTQLVKLEMPNPENRDTGLPIEVRLPGKLVSSTQN